MTLLCMRFRGEPLASSEVSAARLGEARGAAWEVAGLHPRGIQPGVETEVLRLSSAVPGPCSPDTLVTVWDRASCGGDTPLPPSVHPAAIADTAGLQLGSSALPLMGTQPGSTLGLHLIY